MEFTKDNLKIVNINNIEYVLNTYIIKTLNLHDNITISEATPYNINYILSCIHLNFPNNMQKLSIKEIIHYVNILSVLNNEKINDFISGSIKHDFSIIEEIIELNTYDNIMNLILDIICAQDDLYFVNNKDDCTKKIPEKIIASNLPTKYKYKIVKNHIDPDIDIEEIQILFRDDDVIIEYIYDVLNEEYNNGETRYFKMIDPKTGVAYGRYSAKNPQEAASKIFFVMGCKDKLIINTTICIRETTRMSNKKEYHYKAQCKKLDNSICIKDMGNITYRNIIRKIPTDKRKYKEYPIIEYLPLSSFIIDFTKSSSINIHFNDTEFIISSSILNKMDIFSSITDNHLDIQNGIHITNLNTQIYDMNMLLSLIYSNFTLPELQPISLSEIIKFVTFMRYMCIDNNLINTYIKKSLEYNFSTIISLIELNSYEDDIINLIMVNYLSNDHYLIDNELKFDKIIPKAIIESNLPKFFKDNLILYKLSKSFDFSKNHYTNIYDSDSFYKLYNGEPDNDIILGEINIIYDKIIRDLLINILLYVNH